MSITPRGLVEPHVDIRDFDVDPTGGNDSTAGIQLALTQSKITAGNCLPVTLTNGQKTATYAVTSTITMPESAYLRGVGQFGTNSRINFASADITADCFKAVVQNSGMRLENLRLYDLRTNPARTGAGINAKGVRNYTLIQDCNVTGFYDNYVTGTSADCVHFLRNWSSDAIRYGLHIDGAYNAVIVDGFWGDSVTQNNNVTVALVRVGNMNPGTPVIIRSVKQECNTGAHTVQIDSEANVHLDGVTMTWGGGNSGGDVLHLGASVYGRAITAQNIATENNTATNLINVTAASFTIPANQSHIGFWTGWGTSAQSNPGAIRFGRAKLAHTDAVTPEGVIPANKGSIVTSFYRGAYVKWSDDGLSTGYRRVATNVQDGWDLAGGQTSGATLGTVVGKIPVVDVNGNVKGYLPIYNTIT